MYGCFVYTHVCAPHTCLAPAEASEGYWAPVTGVVVVVSC